MGESVPMKLDKAFLTLSVVLETREVKAQEFSILQGLPLPLSVPLENREVGTVKDMTMPLMPPSYGKE